MKKNAILVKLLQKGKSIILSKRMKATYWHAGTMISVALMDMIITELSNWNPDNIITVAVGLVFAQITKILNNKKKNAGNGENY